MNCISKVILCFFLAGICGFNSANVTATDAQVVENETFSLVAGELIVSDGIKEINSGTFNDIDVKSVTKVILPEGLESIRPFTFSKFDNLQEINIPSSVMFVRSRAFGASDIFSPNTKSGIKISVNKEQMPGLIKFAMDNLRPNRIRKTEGVNVDWEVFDASTNKKLSKTFKPTFDDWNEYKYAAGYWKDIVPAEPSVDLQPVEEIAQVDDSIVEPVNEDVAPDILSVSEEPVDMPVVLDLDKKEEPIAPVHKVERVKSPEYAAPIQQDFRSVLKNKVQTKERTDYYKAPEQLDFRHLLRKTNKQ